jgi:hypothetical protein
MYGTTPHQADTLVELSLIPEGKQATRLPEAMWVGFNPPTQSKEDLWTMDKLGTRFFFNETVRNGSKYLHGTVIVLLLYAAFFCAREVPVAEVEASICVI